MEAKTADEYGRVATEAAKSEFNIGWSIYAGWMPWAYAEKTGILKKWADKYGIAHVTTDLAESLARPEVDAVILCTPTQMHAEQAIACMDAGKHVQVEIPLADSWADAEAVLKLGAGGFIKVACERAAYVAGADDGELDEPLLRHTIERMYREAKLFQIGDGTSEVLRLLVSRFANRRAGDRQPARVG